MRRLTIEIEGVSVSTVVILRPIFGPADVTIVDVQNLKYS